MSVGRRAYNLLRGYVHREWERVRGLEEIDAVRELESPPDPRPMEHRVDPPDPKEAARRILGVAEGAPFEDVLKAYERLNRRSDPANFPEGSIEREHAAELQRKVQWAYRQLSDGVSVTEQRFRSLEIE